MPLYASYHPYKLQFKQASGTSRGVLTYKETYFLVIKTNDKIGIGECALFRGLSADDRPDYEEKLQWLCQNINENFDFLYHSLAEFPSMQFGLETAFVSLQAQHPFVLYPSAFTAGKQHIAINGLVWMGDEAFMKQQIQEKLATGFRVIKLKIGAIDFEKECSLLAFIRKNFDPKTIEIRVDANGAFKPHEALEKLKQLATYHIHSIEQPIAKNQPNEMATLCQTSPIPIALDEELIGVFTTTEKVKLLKTLQPPYIILKPSLVGGFTGTNEWIAIAEQNKIGWWITSALESNIGLNALAQYTFTKHSPMPQGLGTGGLFTNNFDSPLYVENGFLKYDEAFEWQLPIFLK